MGHGLSAYRDIDAEPLHKTEVYEKFEDTSRPLREMVATQKEMDMGQVPRKDRDYCAHIWMQFVKCRRDWFPELWNCHDILHDYQHCSVNDIKHNMMEYERTKRLMARERRRLERRAKEEMND